MLMRGGFLLFQIIIWMFCIKGFANKSENVNSKKLGIIKGILLVDSHHSEKITLEEGIQVKGINLPTSFSTLEKYLKKDLFHQLTLENLEHIKASILHYYQDNCHPFVLVSMPEQYQENETIKVVVSESKVDHVEIKDNTHFSSCIFRPFISQHKGEWIDTSWVAQDLYWINKNPFINASVSFSPGSGDMSTDITYHIQDRHSFQIYAGGDNTGIESTGMGRIYAGFNWGNVWDAGHILTFQETESLDVGRYRSFTASYSFPFFGKNWMSFYGGYSLFHPKRTISGLRNKGHNYQVSGRYTFPLPAIKFSTVQDLSVGVDIKQTNTNLTFNEQLLIGNTTLITQFALHYHLVSERNYHKIPVDIHAYYMPGRIFPNQKESDFQSLRYEANNHYLYINFCINPYIQLPEDFGISLNLKSQFSTANLLSSEQFGLGGYDSVRGYEYREVNTDNGILVSGEFLTPSLKKNQSIRGLVFLDFGMGWNHIKTPSIDNPVYLLGIGPGIRIVVNPYVYFRTNVGYGILRTDYDPSANRIQWDIGGVINY